MLWAMTQATERVGIVAVLMPIAIAVAIVLVVLAIAVAMKWVE